MAHVRAMDISDSSVRILAILFLFVQGLCYPVDYSRVISLSTARRQSPTGFNSRSVFPQNEARTTRDEYPTLNRRAITLSPTNKLAIGLGLGFGVLFVLTVGLLFIGYSKGWHRKFSGGNRTNSYRESSQPILDRQAYASPPAVNRASRESAVAAPPPIYTPYTTRRPPGAFYQPVEVYRAMTGPPDRAPRTRTAPGRVSAPPLRLVLPPLQERSSLPPHTLPQPLPAAPVPAPGPSLALASVTPHTSEPPAASGCHQSIFPYPTPTPSPSPTTPSRTHPPSVPTESAAYSLAASRSQNARPVSSDFCSECSGSISISCTSSPPPFQVRAHRQGSTSAFYTPCPRPHRVAQFLDMRSTSGDTNSTMEPDAMTLMTLRSDSVSPKTAPGTAFGLYATASRRPPEEYR